MTGELGPRYRALALQTTTVGVNGMDVPEARAAMLAAAGRLTGSIAASNAFLGGEVRLVVLPEYFLTGYPMGDSIEGWRDKAAIAPDGPEYEVLGKVAQTTGVHLSGNAYETDPHFPELYFQTSFVIAPDGDVVLRYRRLHSMYSPSPFDVWDAYIDRYGLGGLLPVARTELGSLAAIASEEILYPELARALALRGAEVFVHSSSEVGSPRPTPKGVAKVARAIENLACVVSANSAGITGTPMPAASTDGGSQIVDHTGAVLVEAGPGESMVANAIVDVGALRAARRTPGMGNLLARVKPALWTQVYADADVERPNGLQGGGVERAYFVRRQAEVIDRLQRAGVIT